MADAHHARPRTRGAVADRRPRRWSRARRARRRRPMPLDARLGSLGEAARMAPLQVAAAVVAERRVTLRDKFHNPLAILDVEVGDSGPRSMHSSTHKHILTLIGGVRTACARARMRACHSCHSCMAGVVGGREEPRGAQRVRHGRPHAPRRGISGQRHRQLDDDHVRWLHCGASRDSRASGRLRRAMCNLASMRPMQRSKPRAAARD